MLSKLSIYNVSKESDDFFGTNPWSSNGFYLQDGEHVLNEMIYEIYTYS